MRSGRRRMMLVGVTVALVIMLAASVGWAQSADGPYFVVDQSVANETTHVFKSISNALAKLDALGKEAWGATLVLLPGNYDIPVPLIIATPYLKIVTRDGTDKARLVPTAALTNAINITARGVTLEDVKLIGAAGAVIGIRIAAPDVTLKNVLVSGFAGNGLTGTGDRLSIVGCSFSNNGANGVGLLACPDALINDCDIRNNTLNGVAIAGSNDVVISASRISNNAGAAVTIVASSYVQVTDNTEIRANGGPAMTIGGSAYCQVSGNGLIGNASGIIIANSVACTVQSNTCENTLGPAVSLTDSTGNVITKNYLYGVENPPVGSATILLSGNATGNTVSENVLTKNTWGIVLNNIGVSGNLISSNEISDTSQAGIYVRECGGSNVIEKNSISDSIQFGLWIRSGQRDKYADNMIKGSASVGINVDDTVNNVTNCLVINNLISESGGQGIDITAAPNTNTINGLTLSNNTISDGAANGILVSGGGVNCNRLSIEFNNISENEGNGVSITGTVATSLWRNIIHDNEKEGLVIAGLSGAASVRQNTIYANQRGGVQYTTNNERLVLEENSIFSNLGHALSVVGPSLPGTSFAKNWWGSATGPAGAFNGVGNAVLGVSAVNIQPILSAPPLAGIADDAVQILAIADAQISFINSFTAGRVVVDRTDTAGLKLVFTEVSVRNNAFVATMPFTTDALKSKVFTGLGDVLAASGVLVSGIQDGMVSVGFEYSSKLTTTDGTLALYVYQGGQWKLDDSGTWVLEGGNWNAVPNCHFGDTNQVLGDVPVESLTGDVKAIALVLESPKSE